MKIGPITFDFVDAHKLAHSDKIALLQSFHAEKESYRDKPYTERFIPYCFYQKWLTQKLINENSYSNP